MNKIFYITIALLLCISSQAYCAKKAKTVAKKDVKIQKEIKLPKEVQKFAFQDNLKRNMFSAGYWISKLSLPDEVLFDEQQVSNFNKKMQEKGVKDIGNYPDSFDKAQMVEKFQHRLTDVAEATYCDEKGQKIDLKFFENIQNTIDLDHETFEVKYAFTLKYCDIRILPSESKIFPNINSKDIDKLQEESIDIATPVAVICTTKDKTWSYIATQIAEGWIKTDALVFTDKKRIQDFVYNKKNIVVISAQADIFYDEDLTKYLDTVRMGTIFEQTKKTKIKNTVCINIPTKDENGAIVDIKAYIKAENINVGFLPYTKRNVLTQAFKMLDMPYGWGGTNGRQDCSGFIEQIYKCFGMILPETSADKIKCGESFDVEPDTEVALKNKILSVNAYPAESFIYMPGHIMLYIGEDDGKHYVIHSIWGTKIFNENKEETVKYINKVIVSDLNVGNETSNNSLIERLTAFTTIR